MGGGVRLPVGLFLELWRLAMVGKMWRKQTERRNRDVVRAS
jgi:hypothetical protein